MDITNYWEISGTVLFALIIAVVYLYRWGCRLLEVYLEEKRFKRHPWYKYLAPMQELEPHKRMSLLEKFVKRENRRNLNDD